MPESSSPRVHFPPGTADPQPISNIRAFWNASVQVSIVGIFLLALGTILVLAQTFVLPIVSAIIFGLILSPAAAYAARYHIPSWLFAIMVVGLIVILLNLVIALLSTPIVEWVGKAPEIATTIKNKLQVLDRPLAGFKDLQGIISQGGNSGFNIDTANLAKTVLAFLTPALSELLLFFVTLFFLLIGRTELRGHAVLFFENRDTRLLIIRILNDIEQNLTLYIGTVSMINLCVGVITAIIAYMAGFPDPLLWGIAACALNFVPYIGPAMMTIVLFCAGLVIFSSLGHALLAPALFLTLATLEGHFITPNIVGKRLALNPLIVFLVLAFWTWMWGPIGAFLAAPFSIIGLVIFNHLFIKQDAALPG